MLTHKSFIKKTFFMGVLSLASMGAIAGSQTLNPIVAKVGNKKIYRLDVEARQKMIPELQAAPIEAVFDGLRDQMVAEALIGEEVGNSNLDNDPEVLEKARRCKEAAKLQVFLERQIEKMVTDEELMSLFKDVMKDYKKQKEVNAQHILVANEKEAHAVIKDLEAGKEFKDVARQRSIDPTTKERGGDLGYFVKDIANETMGPDFSEAVFILRPGNFTRKPIKTRFGYHVVKVNDSRMSKPPKFEDVAPQLRMIKSQEALMKYIEGLRGKKKVEVFDMKGSPSAPKKVKIGKK